jgi:membrane protein YdbS with pleckstrin-like domain
MDTIDNFTNEVIETAALPRFEEAPLTLLHPSFKKIMQINIAITFGIIGIAIVVLLSFVPDAREFWMIGLAVYVVSIILSILLTNVSFRNRGFAFRNHDVIYKSGVLATKTTIIPYNRIQHAALHEGILSRRFGLAAVEVFTAGGNNGDIEIPGIEKEHAEKIKQLLVGKILKQEDKHE